MSRVKLSSMANRLAALNALLEQGGRAISLDPSSASSGGATGVAVFDCKGTPSLIYAGRLRSKPVNAPAYERIDQIVDQVIGLTRTYHADLALIETTTGKTSGGGRDARGAGLAIYGVAVGAVRQALRSEIGKTKVIGILENDWTARTNKLERWHYCRASYPSFSAVWQDDDGKYDASDAAYLFHWCEQVCVYSRPQPA